MTTQAAAQNSLNKLRQEHKMISDRIITDQAALPVLEAQMSAIEPFAAPKPVAADGSPVPAQVSQK